MIRLDLAQAVIYCNNTFNANIDIMSVSDVSEFRKFLDENGYSYDVDKWDNDTKMHVRLAF
jgi:hypothetical protein